MKRFKIWATGFAEFDAVINKATELGYEISEFDNHTFWTSWGYGGIGLFFFIGASPNQIGYTRQKGTYENHSFEEMKIEDFFNLKRKVSFEK